MKVVSTSWNVDAWDPSMMTKKDLFVLNLVKSED